MRRACVLALSCSLLLGLTTVTFAQHLNAPESSSPSDSPAFVPLSPDQDRELTTWLTAIEKWQRYDAKWQNRPVRDGWARIVSRKPPPDAPEWLEAYCASAVTADIVEVEARTRKACRLLADPRATERMPSAVQAAEKPPKHSSFLTRVHVDWLWTTTSTDARLYGIVGSHVSLVDVGRLQIFGPPGVILLSVPDDHGGRRITLGYTWGVSVRLVDLRVAAPTKNLALFLNVSKVWVGGGIQESGNAGGFDIVGFSIASRKKR
jgi:hypothetical protein